MSDRFVSIKPLTHFRLCIKLIAVDFSFVAPLDTASCLASRTGAGVVVDLVG